MRWWWSSWALWLWALPASAQLSENREHERQMDSGRLSLSVDLNTFFGSVEGSGYAFIQPTALVAMRAGEAVFEAAVPFAYFHENNDPGAEHNQLSVANLWFGLAYLPDTSCGLSRLSLGVAPDLATASDARDAMALRLARAAIGDWDGYLWIDDMLPLVLGVSTLKELSFLRLAWDADLVWGLAGAGRDAEFGAQTAVELALRFSWQTSIGARLSGAYYPTISGDDFQSALTFFARYSRPHGDSFGARFVMNLDGPAGFSFAQDGVWGLGLFYGAAL